ncbi:hypothetical protein Tco_0795171 [Tanacetum coccineum]
MRQMGFGVEWRKWVFSCLSSASISVLINSSPSSEFKIERGLRQDDPLSPLLFLLVAEALQMTVLEACGKGVYNGVSLGSSGTNCFEKASGLKVNIAKSRLYGVGVSRLDVEVVASSLGCDHGSFPFIYLGLPVGSKMNRVVGWNEVVNRVRVRLSSWKAKALSIGGRLTLIKSVLGSLPLYYFSLFKAPMKILNLLESIRSRFFWGFKDSGRGISWVKWKAILLDKEFGGLGVGCLHSKNLGLLDYSLSSLLKIARSVTDGIVWMADGVAIGLGVLLLVVGI